MTAGAVRIETKAFRVLDRTVSARAVWREISAEAGNACVGSVNRSWRYSLNYYSATPLPDCGDSPRPIRIEPDDGREPRIERR